MTDIATVTKRAHDTGFGQGSLTAVNAILAYLDHIGHRALAEQVLHAWENGTIAKMAGLAVAEPQVTDPDPHRYGHNPADMPSTFGAVAPTDLGPPKMTRDQATSAGFTGNSCAECGSMQMVRNGTCEKCNACGATTGCS